MRKLMMIIIILIGTLTVQSQSCAELIQYVKENSYGTTYSNYNSEAISKVTFYSITADYQTYYYAIVCFKNKYSYKCSEYIYQVSSNTKLNYSMNYLNSAGKAFWKYIQPYADVLGCSPDFK